MRTIGLIGGMSWESTAVYYRQINENGPDACWAGLASAKIADAVAGFRRSRRLAEKRPLGRRRSPSRPTRRSDLKAPVPTAS